MRLVIATRNPHKLVEIRRILHVPAVELVGMEQFPEIPDVVEDGATFVANAIKKAVVVAKATRLWAMADDSGLEVDVLQGAPGVYSARYAGEPVSYEANNRKLLEALSGQTNRRAQFRCIIAVASPAGRSQIVEGICPGRIIERLRGTNGFGYDPLFIPAGCEQTFSEMNDESKNRISHRALALQAARVKWGEWLGAGVEPGW
jgi:XTP/dITP diphosphohydrolase